MVDLEQFPGLFTVWNRGFSRNPPKGSTPESVNQIGIRSRMKDYTMPDFPSINQVVLCGVLREIQHFTNVSFTCRFKIGVGDGDKETIFECGTGGRGEQMLRRSRINYDWVFVVGQVMTGVFVPVREMSIMPGLGLQDGFGYVSVFGRIVGISKSKYTRLFDVEVYSQSGPTEKRRIDALLKCSVSEIDHYAETFRVTEVGHWAGVQGKILGNGFVRASSFFTTTLNPRISIHGRVEQKPLQR